MLATSDPILASSVVGKGKFAQEHVPAHIRHVLQAESGSNDGAAFPFLYLALFLLMRDGKSVGDVVGYWVALVLLYQIILGTVIGASVGILYGHHLIPSLFHFRSFTHPSSIRSARKALKFSKRRKLIDRESMVRTVLSTTSKPFQSRLTHRIALLWHRLFSFRRLRCTLLWLCSLQV